MNILNQWFATSFLSFLGFICLISLNKKLRGQRGALNSQLNFADVGILGVAALFISFPLWPIMIKWLIGACVFIYSLLLWLDALLFVQYRIEINRHSLAWFFTGSKGLIKGVPELLLPLNRFSPASLLPVLTIVLLVSINQSIADLTIISLAILLFTLVSFFYQRQHFITSLFLSVGSVSFSFLLSHTFMHWTTFIISQSVNMFAISVLILTSLYVYKYISTPRFAFFSTPSLLPNIIKSDIFKDEKLPASQQENVNKIARRLKANSHSEFHGQCRKANVILITVESLGPYIAPYPNPLVESKLAKRFVKNTWMSQQHFSLCPNTTVATNQIYTGQYSNNPYNKDESDYFGAEPYHLKHLKQQGYKTLFVDSANTQLYDYQKLLNRIGFDRIWGTADMPSNGLKADYRLWNMVDDIVDEIADEPFFMHIINDQTHMPYEIVDKANFNRHKGSGNKAKYLNAFEEVDYILDEFLNRLEKRIDLSNTVVIFTGDHGESFGEYGYSFHSNSVISEQTQVPFFITHPALDNRKLAHSCHFDVFPTLFDLLGMTPTHHYFGQTMGFDEKEKAYFFHSATLKGNTPANFCSLIDNHMYWNDRLFSQAYELKWSNGNWLRNSQCNGTDISALNTTLLNSFSLKL
jgi:hypothetical protein